MREWVAGVSSCTCGAARGAYVMFGKKVPEVACTDPTHGASHTRRSGAVLMPEATKAAANAAADAAQEPGLFDIVLVKPFEYAIVSLHGFLNSVGIQEAYGPAIILFTLLMEIGIEALNHKVMRDHPKHFYAMLRHFQKIFSKHPMLRFSQK